MAGRWEFFDHTADIGLVAHGRSPAEVFANAGAGLFDLMVDLSDVRETTAERIEVAGVDRPDLLVGWLNELLYLFEVDGLVLTRFDVELTDGDRRLVATGHGERLDPSRHGVKLGVKAATYHQAAVEQVAGAPEPRWRARVILDV